MYGVSLPHDVLPNCQAGSLWDNLSDSSLSTREKASWRPWLLAATAVVSIIFPSGVNVPDNIEIRLPLSLSVMILDDTDALQQP